MKQHIQDLQTITPKRASVRSEKKPQISPLRFAPVEMTNLLHGNRQLSSGCTTIDA